MKQIYAAIRFTAILTLIAGFILVAIIINWLPLSTALTRRLVQDARQLLSYWALRIIGVELLVSNRQLLTAQSVTPGRLLIANHLSYLDILVLASLVRMAFVTSVEIRDTPGLGLLARTGGCIFVERRSRENIDAEVGSLKSALLAGENVTVFPEATSTNGDVVLPFKRSMFRAVEDSSIPVLPLAIRYTHAGGMPITEANRDKVHWYGSMDFLPHLWKLCQLGSILARVDIQTPFNTVPQLGRKELAEYAHQVISGAYAAGIR